MSNRKSDTQPPSAPSLKDRAYPQALREQEAALLRRRPGGRNLMQVGLALSGGGIRSATFAFGVIQAFARTRILDQIDVLSTVSGGGYAASVITRLFARDGVKNCDDVRRTILPESEPTNDDSRSEEPDPSTDREANEDSCRGKAAAPAPGAVLRWLRDNGRYLAPNGSGDLLLNGAVLLRNWLSVQGVLIILILALFVLMQGVRDTAAAMWSATGPSWLSLCVADGKSFAILEAWLTCGLPMGNTYLWWSPWVVVPALVVALLAIPLGSVYWLAADHGKSKYFIGPAVFLVLITLLSLTHKSGLVATVPAVVLLLSWLVALVLFVWVRCSRSDDHAVVRDAEVRNRLSSGLRLALLASGVFLALALVDTFGQTVYAVWLTPGAPRQWFATAFTALAGAFAGARWLAVVLLGRDSRRAGSTLAAGRGGGWRRRVSRSVAGRAQRSRARYCLALRVSPAGADGPRCLVNIGHR